VVLAAAPVPVVLVAAPVVLVAAPVGLVAVPVVLVAVPATNGRSSRLVLHQQRIPGRTRSGYSSAPSARMHEKQQLATRVRS
jgi:hypothetical protein